MERIGGWIQTYTGKKFWPMDPRLEEICIADIAHALSMMCRYTGHVRRFYSVAEHSVHIARLVSPELRKWALLHDASEAYLSDIARPVKPYLENYYKTEENLMQCVAKAFNLTLPIPDEVKMLDNRILLDERAALLGQSPDSWGDELERLTPLGVKIEGWWPGRAKYEFMREWNAA